MGIDKNYIDYIVETLSGQVHEILDNNVAPKVNKVQKRKIQEVVYDAYEPDPNEQLSYDRRKNKRGGLLWGATSTMQRTNSHNKSELLIYNRAEANMAGEGATFKEDLPFLIEFGHGAGGMFYDFPINSTNTEYLFLNPRPFMEETYIEIKDTRLVERTLQTHLKKLGYKVKI